MPKNLQIVADLGLNSDITIPPLPVTAPALPKIPWKARMTSDSEGSLALSVLEFTKQQQLSRYTHGLNTIVDRAFLDKD